MLLHRRKHAALAGAVALCVVAIALVSVEARNPSPNCNTDKFDAQQWRYDVRTLAGLGGRTHGMTRGQWMARIVVKCVGLKGADRREVLRKLGHSPGGVIADSVWYYSLGNRVGVFARGSEDLAIEFGTNGRVKRAAIEDGPVDD